jgi:hypothetical protein
MSDSIASFFVGAVKSIAEQFDRNLRDAYERGVADGRRLAADELRSKLAVVLSDESSPPQGEIAPHGHLAETPAKFTGIPAATPRARRGSVAPAVLAALSDIKGKKPAQIAAETGISENSVRGTLNKLRKDKLVFKAGEIWRQTGPIRDVDGTLVQVTPDGRIISVPEEPPGNGNPDAGASGLFGDGN